MLFVQVLRRGTHTQVACKQGAIQNQPRNQERGINYMAIFKRGTFYWYEFVFDGQRIQKPTKTRNKEAAKKIEAKERVRLAMVKAGLEAEPPSEPPSEPPLESEREGEQPGPTRVPTLSEFAAQFREHVGLRHAQKPETVRFYNNKLDRLLEYKALAQAALDQIDEELLEAYVTNRVKKKLAPATVNREVTTLRKLMRFAMNKRKIIKAVPAFEMLSGERQREFVLSHEQEQVYFSFAPGHLKDAALLALGTGLRVGELVALLWQDVHLEPAGDAKFGYLFVRSGKTRNARRTVLLTGRVSAMLSSRVRISPRVFPVSANTLQHHQQKLRDQLGMDKDFTIHSFRHTMLTRLGESGADAFTIKRIAGHSSITISERYVHPTPEHVERMFERFERHGVPTKVPTFDLAENGEIGASPVQ